MNVNACTFYRTSTLNIIILIITKLPMSEYSKYSYYEFSHLNIHVFNITPNSRIAFDSTTYGLAKHFLVGEGGGSMYQ